MADGHVRTLSQRRQYFTTADSIARTQASIWAALTRSVCWGPIAIMGGFTIATLLTIFFVPALYAAWFRIVPVSATLANLVRQTHGNRDCCDLERG